jgi:hypothetical protein
MASSCDRAPGRPFRPWVGVLLALLALAGSAVAAPDSVTIKMFLNNLQAKAVRDAKGRPVTIRLSTEQKALVRVRAPKFKGNIIRVARHQLGSANKISLTILKAQTNTPVLRVEDRAPPPQPELAPEAEARAKARQVGVELAHLQERIAAYGKRLETLEKQLRAR